MKRLCVILLSVLATINIFGQDKTSYQSTWQFRPMLGINIPMTRLLEGSVTDYLIEYKDEPTFYWQIISASYFFSKHWGVDLNIQVSSGSNSIKQNGSSFIAAVTPEYSDKYYVNAFTPPYDNEYENDAPFAFLFYGKITRGYLGLIYRLETNKFYVYPKFSIGINSLSNTWGSVDLKEKNAHNEYQLKYWPKTFSSDNFTLAPSVSIGYKLTNRFFLNMEALTSWSKTNVIFEKEFKDLTTQHSQKEEIIYNKNIFNFRWGIGLIFVLKQQTKNETLEQGL